MHINKASDRARESIAGAEIIPKRSCYQLDFEQKFHICRTKSDFIPIAENRSTNFSDTNYSIPHELYMSKF